MHVGLLRERIAHYTRSLRVSYRSRSRREVLARELSDSLRAHTESLSEGLYALDLEGRLTFMNSAMERMLGWSHEDLLGKRVHSIIHARRPGGASLPEKASPILAVLRTGRPHRDDEDCLTRKDGSLLPVSQITSPIWKEGRVAGFVLAFRDSTERRFLAEASRLLEEWNDPDVMLERVAQLAADRLGDGCMVAVLDPDGRPRLVATKAAGPREAGAPRESEAARSADVPSISARELDWRLVDLAAEHGLGRVLRTGEAVLLREIAYRVENEGAAGAQGLPRGARVESFMGLPMRARGRLVGAIGFAAAGSSRRFDEHDLDLGEELARRCALAVDYAELHRSMEDQVRARGEVLSIVAHELRGPLSTILISSKVVEKQVPRGPEGEAARTSSRLIARCATLLSRLAGDLMDFSSIEAGRLSIVRAPYDAAGIARETIEAFQALAGKRRVALTAPTEPLTIECDRDRILQALSNLLSNAIQASPEGSVVAVSVAEREGQAEFSVKDRGPGIPAEELPYIFERYQRGRSSHYKGTGLGLAIARQIIESHGGRIWAESAPGQGSTFRFRLPAVRREVHPDILLVDDDADMRASLRSVLELEGYRVALASNGREAWEWLQSAPVPALILLDLMMPLMDGTELLGLVRTDVRLRSVPVVLVTAFGSLAGRVSAHSQGLLTKPFDVVEVIRYASRYCPARRPRVN